MSPPIDIWNCPLSEKRSNNDSMTKEWIFCVWFEFNTDSILQAVYVKFWVKKGGIDWSKSHEKLGKMYELLNGSQNQSDWLLIIFPTCHLVFNVNLTSLGHIFSLFFGKFHWGMKTTDEREKIN